MTTEQSVFLVLTNPVPGRETEFDEWYEQVHIPEMLALPGWQAVRRFTLAPHQRAGTEPTETYSRLAIYEVAGDGSEALAALAKASSTLNISSVMAPGRITSLWNATGERHVSTPTPAMG